MCAFFIPNNKDLINRVFTFYVLRNLIYSCLYFINMTLFLKT